MRTREQHDALLTARREMLKAIKGGNLNGPKTQQMIDWLDDLKTNLHLAVPPKMGVQAEI